MTLNKPSIPDFVVIGGMKCGSTALWRYLYLHPEIHLPDKRKNLEFFNTRDNWHKGVEWYQKFFYTEDPKIKVIGEVSTEYTKFPFVQDVPYNMSHVIPNAKLIYLIRNPIERIISHYIHSIGAAEETRDINTVLENTENNPYILYSLYFYQLQKFLRYYSKKNILVITTEELKKHRNETLRTIFQFIGVNPSLEVKDEILTNTSEDRRKWNFAGRQIRKSVKLYNYYNYYLSRFPKQVRPLIENMLSASISRPVINDKIRARIEDIVKEDIENLRQFCGLQDPHWEL